VQCLTERQRQPGVAVTRAAPRRPATTSGEKNTLPILNERVSARLENSLRGVQMALSGHIVVPSAAARAAPPSRGATPGPGA
jgi:hypothetical protein